MIIYVHNTVVYFCGMEYFSALKGRRLVFLMFIIQRDGAQLFCTDISGL